MGQFGVSTILGVGRFPVFGEPDHYLQMRPRPTAELPQRAIVSFPNGRALFDSPADAETYLDSASS